MHSIFNALLKSCIDQHASLRRTKITRPPAPWLNKVEIREMQKERNKLRYLAHQTSSPSVWDKFREVRNKIRTKIKKVKREFIQKALSSKKPKELWNTIHRILNPTPQPIKADPDALNKHFSVVHFVQDKKYDSTRHQEVVSTKSRSIQA